MRARIARLWGAARRGFPLTGVGVGVAALSAAALAVGLQEIDLVLLGAGGIGATLVLIGLLTVAIGVVRVRLALRKVRGSDTPLVMECGYPVRTGFVLPSLRLLPNASVSWRWVGANADVRVLRRGLSLEEELTPHVRGWSESARRRIEVSDGFGLVSVAFVHEHRRPARMLPAVGGLRQMNVVRTLAGGADMAHPEGTPEGDRLDLRAYAPGDPIRFVLWNVFARTRELVVRTPEKAVAEARKTLAYLVSAAGDEPAAGAARVAVDAGALGGEWAFGADGVDEPAETKDAALEALARSAAAPPETSGRGLADFMRKAAKQGGGRALVFVPGKPGPWLDGIVEAASQLSADAAGRLPIEFIVGTDGATRDVASAGWRRLAYRRDGAEHDAHDAPVDRSELDRVVSTLGRLRAGVTVVDRRDGHLHRAAA